IHNRKIAKQVNGIRPAIGMGNCMHGVTVQRGFPYVLSPFEKEENSYPNDSQTGKKCYSNRMVSSRSRSRQALQCYRSKRECIYFDRRGNIIVVEFLYQRT